MVAKKLGRPCKYGEGNYVEQVAVYVPTKTLDKLPGANRGRNDWIIDAIDKKLASEEKGE